MRLCIRNPNNKSLLKFCLKIERAVTGVQWVKSLGFAMSVWVARAYCVPSIVLSRVHVSEVIGEMTLDSRGQARNFQTVRKRETTCL